MKHSLIRPTGGRAWRRAGAVLLVSAAGALAPSAHFVSASGTSPSMLFHYHPLVKLVHRAAHIPRADMPTRSQCLQLFGVECLNPIQIRRAYDVPSDLTGVGQTIVIVDAFGDPTVTQDLHAFDQQYNLPDPTVNVFYPGGHTVFDPNNQNMVGWAVEVSLDVQYAHAIAPGATIDLVAARSDSSLDLNIAEEYAIARRLGNSMSESYGEPESWVPYGADNTYIRQSHADMMAATATGMTVMVSSGDGGANEGQLTDGTQYVGQTPSGDPNVTAVGGTDLYTDDSGNYQSETVWNDSDPASCAPIDCAGGLYEGATGGSPSAWFAKPNYQKGITPFATRSTSDVAWNGGGQSFVWVYLGMPGLGSDPGFYGVYGTSESSPSFAGVVALADAAVHHGLGNINPWMYSHMVYTGAHPIFHDITVGQNGDFEGSDSSVEGPGYPARPGWDAPTGVGTPDVRNFVNALAGTNY